MADSDVMWDWIAAYVTPVNGSFWILRGLEEYQRIYHHSFEQDVMMCYSEQMHQS